MYNDFRHDMPYVTLRLEVRSYRYISVATGFLYSTKVALSYGRFIQKLVLISNRHVFLDSNNQFDPNGELTLHLTHRNVNGTPYLGNSKVYTQTGFHNLYFHPHPTVDLACIDLSDDSIIKDVFFKCLDDTFLSPVNYEKILVGSDVLFVGYPDNLFDIVNNLPLIRKGSIASIPYVDFNGLGHIVLDAQVYPGSSGSPVFIVWDGKYSLIGVISQLMFRNSKLQMLPANTSHLSIRESVGLGIMIKQHHIRELIDHFANHIRQTIIQMGFYTQNGCRILV